MNEKPDGAGGAKTNGNPEQAQQAAEQAAATTPNAARRGGTRAEERIASLDTSGASYAEQVAELTTRLEALQARADEAEAGWQRARADYANLKRRTDEQRAEWAGLAADRLLVRVIELADDFDLAVEHVPESARGTPWVEGIAAIDRKLRTLLEAEGVEAMTGEGAPFDPQTQQAVSYEDTDDVPDGTVIKILQRGFRIRDRVVRPALVAVARNESVVHDDHGDGADTDD